MRSVSGVEMAAVCANGEMMNSCFVDPCDMVDGCGGYPDAVCMYVYLNSNHKSFNKKHVKRFLPDTIQFMFGFGMSVYKLFQ